MAQIISASRRTDIPGFYAAWFVNRLRERYAVVRQPFSGRLFRVSLDPSDVNGIVFWSKNYAPLLEKLPDVELTTKNLFFHFTITAASELEQAVPDFRDAVRDYRYLAERYSPEQVVWRFDPVCITDRLSFALSEERFVRLAEALKGLARTCIISFVQPYRKTLASLARYSGQSLRETTEEERKVHAQRLAARAADYGMKLTACCNDYLISESVGKAGCIDGKVLSNVFGTPLDMRAAKTRKECACTKSMDIGAYDTCGHGCLYCYANSDKDKAKTAVLRHDPAWNSLTLDAPEFRDVPHHDRA